MENIFKQKLFISLIRIGVKRDNFKTDCLTLIKPAEAFDLSMHKSWHQLTYSNNY